MMGRSRVLFTMAMGFALAGCYDWRGAVRHTAAFEHHCPEADVTIMGDNGDAIARSVQLNVCGEERTYRDVGGSRAYVWVDYTRGLDPGRDARPSGTALSTSATRTPDDVRAFLREINPRIMECTGGAPIRFHLAIAVNGHVTELTQLPHDLPLGQGRCIRTLMSTVDLSGEAAALGVTASFAPTPPDEADFGDDEEAPLATSDSASGSATSPDCAPAIRTQIDHNASRVLACVAEASVAITATWEAGGEVVFGINHATDPAIIECARAGLGTLHCPADAPAGHLLHPLAR